MADEKRRLIYELIVEAVGGEKAAQTIKSVGNQLGQLAKAAGPIGAGIAGALTLKGLADSIDDLTKYEAQLRALGQSSSQIQGQIHGMNTVAAETGTSFKEAGQVIQESIQLQQALGRSTDYAAYSADAFIRVALAEGRTAQDAAQQIKGLTFALDSGTLSGKEFNSMLKQSSTFQEAAKQALGKTTEELVAMGKAGDISGPELVKIIQYLEKIGQQTAAATTVESFTQQLKNLFNLATQSFARGAAGGAGGVQIIDPNQVTVGRALRDNLEGVSIQLGAITKMGKNYVDLVGDEIYALGVSIRYWDDEKKAWAMYKATQLEDLKELAEARRRFNEEGMKGLPEGYAAERKKREGITAANAYAEWKAEQDQINRLMAQARADEAERYKKQQEKIAEEREREADRLAKEALRKEKERQDARDKFYDDRITAMERDVDAGARDAMKDFAEKNAKDLQTTIEGMGEIYIPNMARSYLDNFKQMEDVTYELQSALAGLFSGGITSAREFFAQLSQGIANIFAQLAAEQAADWLSGVIKGMFNIGTNPTAANAAASGMDINDLLGGYKAAKGAAFHHGRVIPMAAGGVVSTPTAFPMAGGVTGLMGEAGPEAVMPLKRTSGGRLGVAGVIPNITIENRLGVPATARMERSAERMTLVMEAAQLGASLAEQRMNKSLRTGYGSTAQSVQGTYGLRRRT